MKKFLIRVFKLFMWVFACLTLLLIMLVGALQFHVTQNYITDKAVHFLSKKTNSKVSLGEINIAFPKHIVLKDLYLEDRKKDTLLYSHLLKVDFDFLKLFSKKVEINAVSLDKLTAHISRGLPDSSFNFDFIIDAFASDTAIQVQEDDTIPASWQFSLLEVRLNDIYITYKDDVSGNDAKLRLGYFQTELEAFDLSKNKFKVENVALENTFFSLVQSKPVVEEGSEDVTPIDFDLEEVLLSNIHLKYENKVSEITLALNLGKSRLFVDKIDLEKERIHLNKFELYDTRILYSQNKVNAEDTGSEKVKNTMEEEVKGDAKSNWRVTLKELDLKNNDLRFDDYTMPELAAGIDYNHLDVKDITLNAEDISYARSKSSAFIRQIALRDKSGFYLKKLTAHALVDSVHIVLSDLDLRTSDSQVKEYLSLGYPSLTTIGDSAGNLKVAVNLTNSIIAIRDVLYFQPDLAAQPFFAKNRDKVIRIKTKISGAIKDLRVDYLEASVANTTVLKTKGTIRGLPDVERTFFDIPLLHLVSTDKDVQSLVPAEMLSPSIQVPSTVTLNGFFKGYMSDFNAEASVVTSIGNATARVNMFPHPITKKEGYRAEITATDFNLGILFNQKENLGPVTLTASIDGSGFNADEIQAQLNASVEAAVVNKYAYRNLKLTGKLDQSRFIGNAKMDDQNLAFEFDGDIDLRKDKEKYDFKFNLEGADLKALHLTEDDIRVSGLLTSNILGNDLNTVNGTINLKKALIIKNGKEYPVDSLVFASINGAGNTEISFESHMLSGKFNGNISLTDLPGVLTQHLNSYFSLQNQKTDETLKPQNFNFEVILRDPALIQDVLVPGLTQLSEVTIRGTYNSREKKLNVDVNVPQIEYDGIKIDSLTITVNSDTGRLNYFLNLAQVNNTSYRLENTTLSGKVEKDSIDVQLDITKADKSKALLLAGVMSSNQNEYRFHFDTSGVTFNNEKWTVPENNFMEFGKNTFVANNVKLSRGTAFVFINTVTGDNRKGPLKMEFSDFNLAILSQIFEKDRELLSGFLDGNILFDNTRKRTTFTSDLKIRNFSFMGKAMGDIALAAHNKNTDRYDVKMDITGHANNIHADGFYSSQNDRENLNFDIRINPLNLATVESYTMGQVKRLTGTLTGDLKLTGNTKNPVLNGELAFKDAAFEPSYINTYLKLKDEHVLFSPKGIHLPSFTMVDSLNHTAEVQGAVYTQNYTDFNFDLTVTSTDFLVLNTQAKDNDLYYGKVFLDSKMHVGGTPDQPVLTIAAKVKEGTNLTFINPEGSVAAEESEGIVEFIDMDKKLHPIMAEGLKADTSVTPLTGIDLTLDLAITDEATLKVIVDKASGDLLVLKGNSNLGFGLDPSGKTSLSGKYIISEGSYSLTINELLKREFVLGKGGSVTWNGDPLTADINISAIYTAKAAPLALVEDQLAGTSDEQRSAYKKELPFQVYLYIEGELMNPEISFSMQMPEQYRGEMGGTVYAKVLQLNEDESQLNQQVFALLVLDRFIADDPLANPGGGLASTARSSVSKILSDQLNTLSGKYIKGVDLNIGVESYEDYSGGRAQSATRVQLGLSKKLFNEKVKVQVGGNVDIDGPRANQSNSGTIIGDVTIDYKLTDDGRYVLRAIRKTQYEGAIEGELTRTAISIIFVRDYNKAKEIFRKPKEKNGLSLKQP